MEGRPVRLPSVANEEGREDGRGNLGQIERAAKSEAVRRSIGGGEAGARNEGRERARKARQTPRELPDDIQVLPAHRLDCLAVLVELSVVVPQMRAHPRSVLGTAHLLAHQVARPHGHDFRERNARFNHGRRQRRRGHVDADRERSWVDSHFLQPLHEERLQQCERDGSAF